MVLYENNKEKYDSIPKEKFVQVQKDQEIHDVDFKTKPIGFFMDVWLRFVKNKASVIAAVIIFILSIFAIAGPSMSDYRYDEQHPELVNMPPKIPAIAKMNLGIFDGAYLLENRQYDNLSDPEKYPEGCVLEILNPRLVNGQRIVDVYVDYYKYMGLEDEDCYWLGSDYLGRDIWTRLWAGHPGISADRGDFRVLQRVHRRHLRFHIRLLRRKSGYGDDAYYGDYQRIPANRGGDAVYHGGRHRHVFHNYVAGHQGLGGYGPNGAGAVLPV